MKNFIKLMSLMSLALFSIVSIHAAGQPPQKNYDDITAQNNLGGAKAGALRQFLAMVEAQRAAEEAARQVAAARAARSEEDAARQVDESKKTG
jgi:hypothetical protein